MSFLNVYFPTWIEGLSWAEGNSDLANIPDNINSIIISFLRPYGIYKSLDAKMDTLFYDGDITLAQLKKEISIAKSKRADRIILASAGGEIGGNFLKVNYRYLVDAIYDLGLDGIDLDYEPDGLMTRDQKTIDKYIEIITNFRFHFDKKEEETGKKFLITCAPTGIGLFDQNDILDKIDGEIISNLQTLIPQEEWDEELKVGSKTDDPVLKQPKYRVGTLGSAYNFDSAGKMKPVFMSKIENNPKYNYVGQMVDIILYQAYNMGSGNTLSKIMCYEKHRELSEFFNSDIPGSGPRIGHGSHVGKEAWPHFSYTKKRLGYIYDYINKFGRDEDGASFWSYFSSAADDSRNVPEYGMGFKSAQDVFDFVSKSLGIN